jgi:hypothetical protein
VDKEKEKEKEKEKVRVNDRPLPSVPLFTPKEAAAKLNMCIKTLDVS